MGNVMVFSMELSMEFTPARLSEIDLPRVHQATGQRQVPMNMPFTS
jgi:hypothetical protein